MFQYTQRDDTAQGIICKAAFKQARRQKIELAGIQPVILMWLHIKYTFGLFALSQISSTSKAVPLACLPASENAEMLAMQARHREQALAKAPQVCAGND